MTEKFRERCKIHQYYIPNTLDIYQQTSSIQFFLPHKPTL